MVCCTAGSCHGEQEVPPESHLCQEARDASQKQKGSENLHFIKTNIVP